MPLWQFQSNMNRGELDPLLVGRIDIQAYYNGMRTAFNVLTLPQGGVKRRPGQDFIGIALGDGRLENFSFNVLQSYLLVFTDLKVQIFKDKVLQTNINGSGDDFLVTPWTLAQVQDFDFIQSADTAIITHIDVFPQLLTRTSDTDWSVDAAPLINQPQFNFSDFVGPIIVEVQTLTLANQVEGDRYKIALEGILSEELVFSADDSTNENNIRDAIQNLANIGGSGVLVSTDVALTTYRITFNDASNKNWDLLTVTPVLTKNTTFAGTVIRITVGTDLREDVWSSARGFPKTCVFHEARLFFGGSKSRPATLWGSNVNDFFNFDAGRSRADESIDVTLDTDQVNAIEAIFSNRSLQVFTTGAEFNVTQARGEPITPTNVAVSPQTNLGSKRVRPVSIDGVTLFVQRTGKAVNQFVFVNELQSNQTAPVSSLAAHLINNPKELVASRGTESTDANYVYILNEDGSLTVFNTLTSEGVQAFTSWASGNIKSVSVVNDVLFLLIERVVNGATVFYIESESSVALTDSAVISNVGGSATITGLSHLEGETVDVKADGAYQGTFVVSGGQVVIDRIVDSNSEAGLPYAPLIKTMPVNVGLQNGPNVASKKKILRVAIRMHESNGVIVNGQRLADKTIGVDQFDAPSPQTEIKRITLLGWSLEADIEITQTTPFNMTILSIGMEIKE